MRTSALLVLSAFLSACTSTPTSTVAATSTSPTAETLAVWYDEAEQASTGRDLKKARDLYRSVATRDVRNAERRDRAAVRGAYLEWYVFHDAAAARALFDRVDDSSSEASAAWSERARMETELTREWKAARAAARKAYELAPTLAERETALLRSAAATVEEAWQARLAKRCPEDRDALKAAAADLRKAIDEGGPVLESARLLLKAALLTDDYSTALQAWRWYYADVPELAPQALGDRAAIAKTLAASRLFPEAELVLLDPCVRERVPMDAPLSDILVYSAALRRIGELSREHYRAVARGAENDRAFQRAVVAEAMALWRMLSWPSAAPEFSLEAFQKETERRFGTVATLGHTENIFSLLLGHKVIDERRTVEQYGRRAPLRFIAIDGVVTGGYMTWATHGRSGTGGWIGEDAIYQIRPMYADGPVIRWRRITDPDMRAKREIEIAEETRRDAERARKEPIHYFRGLDLRLQQQASEALRDQLMAEGITGAKLRDAFLERARSIEFDSSILAHEGRHAIDKRIFEIDDSAELEFRAKISEVVFAAIPRGELSSLLAPIGGPGAHGKANERLLKGVSGWMRAHGSEIRRLDMNAALLPQLDKLTDEQLRAAFASMDPLRVEGREIEAPARYR